jgi:hypothetical protein
VPVLLLAVVVAVVVSTILMLSLLATCVGVNNVTVSSLVVFAVLVEVVVLVNN